VGLLLPAGESASVVLQHDFDIHFLTSAFTLAGAGPPTGAARHLPGERGGDSIN
jgi:hypothetical protein